MIMKAIPLSDAFVIELEPKSDNRGYFARTYCANAFLEHGINCSFLQDSISFNTHSNTIRGLHYQCDPFGEEKIVRCIAGSVYDVIVDIRETSSTYLQWFGIELSADNGKALFIPKGFAHGFQTLQEQTALYYKLSANYQPDAATGLRYNDAKLGILWKKLSQSPTISEQDQSWSLL